MRELVCGRASTAPNAIGVARVAVPPVLRFDGSERSMLAKHESLGSSKRMWGNVQRAWEKGLLIDWFLYNEAAFRLAPPLIITDEQLDIISETLHVLLT